MPQTRGHLWSRFLLITRPFFHSEIRWQAFGLLSLLLSLLLTLILWLFRR